MDFCHALGKRHLKYMSQSCDPSHRDASQLSCVQAARLSIVEAFLRRFTLTQNEKAKRKDDTCRTR